MKSSIISALLVLVLSLNFVACGGSEEGKVCESCGIYGHVTDYETGEDVANANVQLRPGGDTTLTGSDGMFEFRGLPVGEYSITVSKAGYTDLIDDYVITVRDRMVRRDVQIKNTKCNDGYFFNGSECANPCDAKPCGSEICEAKGSDTYECKCREGYWDGSKCGEFPPCDMKNITPCIDTDTQYVWSARARQDMDWYSAIDYCDNLSEGGYDNWSLPSKEVLANFYNGNGSSKLGDTGFFWSSTPGGGNGAYTVDFSNGDVNFYYTSYSYSVRCVRW